MLVGGLFEAISLNMKAKILKALNCPLNPCLKALCMGLLEAISLLSCKPVKMKSKSLKVFICPLKTCLKALWWQCNLVALKRHSIKQSCDYFEYGTRYLYQPSFFLASFAGFRLLCWSFFDCVCSSKSCRCVFVVTASKLPELLPKRPKLGGRERERKNRKTVCPPTNSETSRGKVVLGGKEESISTFFSLSGLIQGFWDTLLLHCDQFLCFF